MGYLGYCHQKNGVRWWWHGVFIFWGFFFPPLKGLEKRSVDSRMMIRRENRETREEAVNWSSWDGEGLILESTKSRTKDVSDSGRKEVDGLDKEEGNGNDMRWNYDCKKGLSLSTFIILLLANLCLFGAQERSGTV